MKTAPATVSGVTISDPDTVRRRPRAPISVPLDWDEVRPALDPARWNVRSAARRLSAADPWAGLWRARQRLPRVTGS